MADYLLNTLAGNLGLNLGNINEYPILGNRYYVILGSFITSFSKVSGIVLKSSQLIPFNEGGRNKPYIMHDTKKDFNKLTLEKGYGTLDVMNMVNKVSVLTLIIKGNNNNIIGIYYTNKAVVEEVVLSDLEGNASNHIIQSMSIAYNSLKKADSLMTALGVTNSIEVSTSPIENVMNFGKNIGKSLNIKSPPKSDEEIMSDALERIRQINKANSTANESLNSAKEQNNKASEYNKEAVSKKDKNEKILNQIEF